MNDFRKKVLKVNSSRKHKINNSLGIYDAYKWIRKNKWLDIGRPLTEHEFYTIIRQVNKCLANELLQGNDIVFPHRMGRLELRKYNSKVEFHDGELKTNLPIDWNRTLELWENDKDSYDRKVLVRTEERELFKILYNKKTANYNNKTFYDFEVNREIKKELKHKIKEGIIDAFKL